jgi:hypothetical protein
MSTYKTIAAAFDSMYTGAHIKKDKFILWGGARI